MKPLRFDGISDGGNPATCLLSVADRLLPVPRTIYFPPDYIRPCALLLPSSCSLIPVPYSDHLFVLLLLLPTSKAQVSPYPHFSIVCYIFIFYFIFFCVLYRTRPRSSTQNNILVPGEQLLSLSLSRSHEWIPANLTFTQIDEELMVYLSVRTINDNDDDDLVWPRFIDHAENTGSTGTIDIPGVVHSNRAHPLWRWCKRNFGGSYSYYRDNLRFIDDAISYVPSISPPWDSGELWTTLRTFVD